MARIDLNSDLGESFGAWTMGDDAAMLEIVTSANVACGFHAGDPAGILQTLREAARRGVSIGAHVAYPDLSGFGRRNMDVASADLRAGVIYQIGALQALARVAGTQVRYVKPHGALYNTIAHDRRQATDVIEAVKAADDRLALVVLAGSPLAGWARELSGGQKQRIAIVRALCMNPEVILLDEITAALDPEMVREVLDVVLELAREGMSMIIVTHEMGFAEKVADRIVFMDQGRINEEGAPAEFFARPQTERARVFLNGLDY